MQSLLAEVSKQHFVHGLFVSPCRPCLSRYFLADLPMTHCTVPRCDPSGPARFFLSLQPSVVLGQREYTQTKRDREPDREGQTHIETDRRALTQTNIQRGAETETER